AWNGAPYRMFVTRPESGDSNALDLPAGDVAAISKSGEMLVSIGRHYLSSWMAEGTLGRVRLLGSGPREILERVREAEFLQGDAIAIARRVDGKDRLEVPQGKVVFETAGYISYLRAAPDGERLAFLEHPVYGDNRGFVTIYERGATPRLTTENAGLEGLVWSTDGRELWFGGTNVEPNWTILAVGADARDAEPRQVWSTPGNLVPLDIDARGRLLVSSNTVGGSFA